MYFQGKKTLCKAQNPSMEVEKLSDLEIKQPPDPALSASCLHFQGTFWLNPPLRSSSICLCIWSIHYECLIKKTKTLMISCCSLCYTVSPLLVNIHYIQQQNIKMILIKKWFKACYWSQEENELWRNLKIKKHLVRLHTNLHCNFKGIKASNQNTFEKCHLNEILDYEGHFAEIGSLTW